MKKRLVSLILALMALMMVGCVTDINAYKEQVIAEVESYAQSKGQDNYSEYNWTKMQEKVAESQAQMEKESNLKGIQKLLKVTKLDIDQIRTKEQEDNGDFGPDPTDEEGLKYRALQWYAYRHIKAYEDLTMEECMKKVSFYTGYSEYYGCYNGCIVARFFCKCCHTGCAAGYPYYIEGYEFCDPYYDIPIEVYKEGEFYLLTEAYEQGLLTKDDIKALVEYMRDLVEYMREIREGKTNEK